MKLTIANTIKEIKIRLLLLVGLMLTTIFSTNSFAQNFPTERAKEFILREGTNSFEVQTTVKAQYQAGTGNIFEIPFLEIPASEIHLRSAGASATEKRHMHLIKNGIPHIRFFIHPDSLHLYEPLIKRFGIAGAYFAAATSSTRSVLAWPKNNPIDMIFLKLSLAQEQSRLGRIIPGWEVRRSVGITSMLGDISAAKWDNYHASIIPEVAGVYTKASEGIGFRVDDNQPNVLEHGYILRDSDFLTKTNGELYPFFGLFTARPNAEPIIIEIWKKSKKPWPEFIDNFLLKPFIDQMKYLFFYEGIVPEIHGQNMVVELDKDQKRIQHIHHRDVGSMKVILLLRWLNNLPLKGAQSANATYDFKFAEAHTKIDYYLKVYFLRILERDYRTVLENYVPNYKKSLSEIEVLLSRRLNESIDQMLPLAGRVTGTTEAHIEQFLKENRPAEILSRNDEVDSKKTMEFISRQLKKGEFMDLPSHWIEEDSFQNGDYVVTDYGIVVRKKSQGFLARLMGRRAKLFLVFHTSPNLEEIKNLKHENSSASESCASGF